MIVLYNLLLLLGGALGLPFCVVQAMAVGKRRATVWNRMGGGLGRIRWPRRPVWVHALSVGEVLSAGPLIKGLRAAHVDLPVVLSVTTQGGHDMAQRLFAPHVDAVFYFPFDLIWVVRPLVRRMDPRLFLMVETDLWPNLLHVLKRRDVPALLVNGRISPRTYRGLAKTGPLARAMLYCLSCCCMQSDEDAERIAALGADRRKIRVTGNMKFDQPEIAVTQDRIKALRASMGIPPKAPVVIAGSTHDGEEAILLRCFGVLRGRFPELVLVLAPRDPARALYLERMSERAGLRVSLKTALAGHLNGLSPEVVVVDTIGELRQLYGIADLAFVGKSLVKLGGQNPLEPAALKRAVVFGPHMFNFDGVARRLVEAGGAIQVADEAGLLAAMSALLEKEERRREVGCKAYEVFRANQGALKRVLEAAEDFLPPAKGQAF